MLFRSSPKGGGAPSGNLATAIERDFGSLDSFKAEFTKNAVTTFGSGWGWLVRDDGGKLSLLSTSNAATPLTGNKKAVLTCDVWEHAYYIDYRNARPDYIKTFLDSLVNWDFANRNLNG